MINRSTYEGIMDGPAAKVELLDSKERIRLLTCTVGELVGGVREHVVEPTKDAVRVAVWSDWIAERVGLGGVQSMARRDTTAENSNGDGQACHGALNDFLDALRRADVSPRLHDSLLSIHVAELIVGSECRAEGERRRFAKVGGTETSSSAVRDGCLSTLLPCCSDERVCPPRGGEGATRAKAGEGAPFTVRGRGGSVVGRGGEEEEEEEDDGRAYEEQPASRG